MELKWTRQQHAISVDGSLNLMISMVCLRLHTQSHHQKAIRNGKPSVTEHGQCGGLISVLACECFEHAGNLSTLILLLLAVGDRLGLEKLSTEAGAR